jgi:hypothetical protein
MFHFISNISVYVVRSGLKKCIDAMQNKQPIKYGRRMPHSSSNYIRLKNEEQKA